MFTPTYGSRLNWIEAEFAALRYFALNGTDHHSHTEQNAALAGYVRWHNIRAQPKVNFATDSPIRTWTSVHSRSNRPWGIARMWCCSSARKVLMRVWTGWNMQWDHWN